ncbi:hypothetical protein MMAGJ_00160 [Mycolicibacterium mageritense]|uniref:Uncharacterized protein n=1 Tax=Mycolicibacterium mageritense TaxID=53462 RepID=A0ABM7HJS6_MYCME|nr:hypothetical protein MMAGJ_00160 [Mycolicibacterium mageritense]
MPTARNRVLIPLPLLVVQVGDKPSDAELKLIVGTILEEWDELTEKNIRHVFGDHSTSQRQASTSVTSNPKLFKRKSYIRVLLAKNAVNTGWDCPRAEVLFSMRADGTAPSLHSSGRMVRTVSTTDTLGRIAELGHLPASQVRFADHRRGGKSTDQPCVRRIQLGWRE